MTEDEKISPELTETGRDDTTVDQTETCDETPREELMPHDGDDGIQEFSLAGEIPCANRSADELFPFLENVSLFGELIRAAFSDGYHCGACCTEDEVFQGPLWYETKTSPDESTVIRTQDSHSSSGSRKQRKKGLAVAVGLKYAEDMYGRPVVVVPGSRRSPIRALSSRESRESAEMTPKGDEAKTTTAS